ncbi:hypothetical protein cgR_0134 [Corynebacterium glutamicum R]|uniref:Uncharacterized protein n=2 Tax=Corynebacterium glutamicum TaxID=1718 RepID=Q5KRU9_CORGT|nr:hypothetical protein [Corynebacterium glutamicum]BAF53096.1 hypothetical protein cgR_0134 [Corynebacterium glutamicum R]
MAYLLSTIEPGTSWPRQLAELVEQFPTTEQIGIESMGLPPNWKDLTLWAQTSPPS